MTFNNRIQFLYFAVAVFGVGFSGCRSTVITSFLGAAPQTRISTVGTTLPLPTGDNIMTVTVNGSLCDPATQYSNKICTQVTICQVGTSNCQTINDILVDTGSYGLRIFSSALKVPLVPMPVGNGVTGECAQMGDGTTAWGHVDMAGVKLANEPKVEMPIQVMDTEFAAVPASCSTAQGNLLTNPQHAGFNGILGVGLLSQDCGSACTVAIDGFYYQCNGTSCTKTSMAIAKQVQNPIGKLPVDNNGFIIQLPKVAPSGVPSVEGIMVLGIGTQTNNSPTSTLATYKTKTNGTFSTVFSAFGTSSLSGTLDSGTNIMIAPPPPSGLLPDCNATGAHSNQQGYFCPAETKDLTASLRNESNVEMGIASFQIANFNELLSTGNWVFANVGAKSNSGSNSNFVWGLPFFFGKKIYFGLEKSQSSLGTGPYWAYE